jgi:spore germination protein (amino acid permease)
VNKHLKNEISLFQYVLTISGTQVGFGVFTLPREVEEIAGTDGWISIIGGCLITILVSLCIIKIMSKHPGDTLLDVLTKYMGKWIGKAGMVVWILYSLLAVSSLLLSILLIIQVWILPKTPDYAILILLIIPLYMLVKGGVSIISRYAVLVFFLTIWMPLLLIIPLKDSHWIYLLPILKDGWIPILYAAKKTIVAFLGFEYAFVLYPYLKNKQAAIKGMVFANIITLLVYLQITITCFSYFSPGGISKYLWPTLSLVAPLHFPFLERFEIIFLSLYLFLFLDTLAPYFFSAINGINQIFNKKNWYLPTYILLSLFVLYLFFYTPSFYQADVLREWWGVAGYFVCYIAPFLLLIYITVLTSWQRRKR